MTPGFEPTFMTTMQCCSGNSFRCSSDTGGGISVSCGKDISSHLKTPKVVRVKSKETVGFRMCPLVAAPLISHQMCLGSTRCKHLHERNHLTAPKCGVILVSLVTNPHRAVLIEHVSHLTLFTACFLLVLCVQKEA